MNDIITSAPPDAAADTFTVATRFDYSGLPTETQRLLRHVANSIRGLQRAAIVEIGKRLIEAKDKILERGQFTRWAEAELGMTSRTAQNYMNAVRFLEENSESLSVLPADLIYRLATKSAPAAVVQEVLSAADAGTPLARAEIETRLSDYRQRERQIDRIVETSKAKVRPTREQAAARIAREHEERARDQERRHLDEVRRDARLKPVADQVAAALSADLLDEVQAILEGQDHWERHRFTDLLVAAIRGAPERADDVGAEELLADHPATAETIEPEPAPAPALAPAPVSDITVVAVPAPVAVQADPTDPTGWRRMANQCLSSGAQLNPADLRLLTALTGLGSTLPTMSQVDRLEILHASLPAAQGGVL